MRCGQNELDSRNACGSKWALTLVSVVSTYGSDLVDAGVVAVELSKNDIPLFANNSLQLLPVLPEVIIQIAV